MENKEMIEINAFNVFKNYLAMYQVCIRDEKYEPNGKSTFPDYGFNINNENFFLEITSLGGGDILHNGRTFQEDRYGVGSKNILRNIRLYLGSWIPKEYIAVIYLSGPILKINQKKIQALSNFLKEKFYEGKRFLSNKDLGLLMDESKWIDSVEFFEKDQFPRTDKIPFSNIRIPRVKPNSNLILDWSTQIRSPEEGEELKRLINRKEKAFLGAINKGYTSDIKAAWLLIISDDSSMYDRVSIQLSYKNLIKQGINPKKHYQRIFVILQKYKNYVLEL